MLLFWRPGFRYIFLLGALFFVRAGFAQDSDSMRLKELEEVSVRSRKETFLQTTTPAQTLSGARLQRLNSFSVADALRYFSGIQLKDYGGIGGLKTLNVRSLGAQHLGVFYDGIQLGNAQNGIIDLGKFSLDNIETLSLYNSQNTSIFQPARNFGSASSLYITSRQPVFKPEQHTNLKAAFKTGSFGLINPSIYWQQKISENIATTLSAETVNANGRYKTRYKKFAYDTTIVRQNVDVAAQRVELAVRDLGKDTATSWKLQTYFYNSERGLPGAIVAERYYNSQRLWDRNFFTQGNLAHHFTRRYKLLVHLKYANDFTRYLDTTIKKVGGTPLDNTYRQQEYYVAVANEYELRPWWKLALAGDWVLNKMHSNMDHFAFPTRSSALLNLATEIKRTGFIVNANLLGSFVRENVEYGNAADKKNELTPAASISWKPWEQIPLSFRSFYKRIFRMPTFNDLYYTIIGTTTLRPEYTNQYDVGFQYSKEFNQPLSGITLQADVYYNQVKDKIIAIPANNLFRWSMINLGRVSVKGLDAQLQYFALVRQAILLNGTLNYSYQQAVNKTVSDRSYNQQIPYSPQHSGSATAQASYKKWGLNYSFVYTGARYMLPENDRQNYLQPWYTHDLSLTKRIDLRKCVVVAAAEVNNLLNQYYDVVVNYPMPGRNYLLKLSLTL